MKKQSRIPTTFWTFLFHAGLLAVLVISSLLVINLSIGARPTFSLIPALACFVSLYLGNSIPERTSQDRKRLLVSIWLGIVELIVAILFALQISKNLNLEYWAFQIYIANSITVLFAIYYHIFTYLFPKWKFLKGLT